jgi:ABC-type sulfate transport system permease subunit
MNLTAVRHVRGYDVARPVSISVVLVIMLPLVFLPLLSIFIYGTSKGLGAFWSSLTAQKRSSH